MHYGFLSVRLRLFISVCHVAPRDTSVTRTVFRLCIAMTKSLSRDSNLHFSLLTYGLLFSTYMAYNMLRNDK